MSKRYTLIFDIWSRQPLYIIVKQNWDQFVLVVKATTLEQTANIKISSANSTQTLAIT